MNLIRRQRPADRSGPAWGRTATFYPQLASLKAQATWAFTLIELLVVIGIICILAALLLSALQSAKGSAQSAVCKNNLRLLGLALKIYANDFEKYLPGPGEFEWSPLNPYLGIKTNWDFVAVDRTPAIFWCPLCKPSYLGCSYGYNANGTGSSPVGSLLGLGGTADKPIPESGVLVPSDMLAALHHGLVWGGFIGFGWPGQPVGNGSLHRGGDNAVFCDAHVESSRSELIPKRQYTYLGFKPDEAHAKRWNNDNQPHPETWPKN